MDTDMASSGVEVSVAGQRLIALPSAALYWPDEATMFVADLHFGKAACFRAASIPVPLGTTQAALDRLGSEVLSYGTQRLVILGDFWHGPTGRTPEIEGKLADWLEEHQALRIDLVTGNHDLRTGRRTELGHLVESDEVAVGPFVCRHEPRCSEQGYVLCGHLHPSIAIKGRGGRSVRLSCFWFTERIGVLPAFGEFTGTADIDPAPGDRVLGIAGNDVVRIPVGRWVGG